MTQDEIIEMARKAGMAYEEGPNVYVANIDDLQDFAKLVAAKEREACAKDAEWCIQNHLEHLIPQRIRARGKQA